MWIMIGECAEGEVENWPICGDEVTVIRYHGAGSTVVAGFDARGSLVCTVGVFFEMQVLWASCPSGCLVSFSPERFLWYWHPLFGTR